MKTVDEKISDALGIIDVGPTTSNVDLTNNSTAIQTATQSSSVPVPLSSSSKRREAAIYPEIDNDYQKSRETIHELIDIGMEAVKKQCEIANSAQTPRHFEIVGTLIKTVKEAAEALMDNQVKKKEIENEGELKEPSEDSPKVNNTQNIFVGSTAELQKLLKENKP